MYLPEHAAPEKNPEGLNYEPTPEESAEIALAEKLFSRSKKYRSRYDERWIDWYNMYRGKQWKEQRPSYRHSEAVNLIFSAIQSSVPIQMDSRPKFEYLPMEPSDIELAEIMNQVCEADWAKYNWLHQLTEIVYDSYPIGTGIGYMGFDDKKEDGLGAVCFESEDPFYHFPCPGARDFNKKMLYHVKAEPMYLSDIKANPKWPNAKFVKPDVININRMDTYGKDGIKVLVPTDSSVLAPSDQQYSNDENPEALVITLYLDRNYEITEEEKKEMLEDGTPNISYIQKLKYPKGHKIVIAGKVRLESGPFEYEDGKIPYGRLQNYINQRQFWGISEVEQLESPQKIFNKLICFSLDVLTLMGNPVWMVPSESGIDTENMFNQPGLIVEYDGQQSPSRQEGVNLQPWVLDFIDRMKGWFDDVSGDRDVSSGAKPDGVTAASAIQSLQEAAQTRIRQKSRNTDCLLQDLGQMYQSRVFQFYTSPRVFRLTNRDGTMKFFKFHVSHETSEDGEVTKKAHYRPYEQGEQGQVVEGQEKIIDIKGSLDLKVETGSSLAFVKDAEKNNSIQLYDRGIIDGEEVLKQFDWPNREAVLLRMQQQQAMQAQQAAVTGKPPQSA